MELTVKEIILNHLSDALNGQELTEPQNRQRQLNQYHNINFIRYIISKHQNLNLKIDLSVEWGEYSKIFYK